eukprot:6881438-Prymnesium_polylepis.1
MMRLSDADQRLASIAAAAAVRCGDAGDSDAAAGTGADGRAGTQQQQGDLQAVHQACAGAGGPDECPCTRAAPA